MISLVLGIEKDSILQDKKTTIPSLIKSRWVKLKGIIINNI